jgi:hypothetical protein
MMATLPSNLILQIDPQPNSDNVFNVRRLDPKSPYYVGRSPSGNCALLIRVHGGTRTVPLLLAGIQALFSVQCLIREGEAAGTTDVFTVVCCSSQDRTTESYFADVLDLIVQRLGDVPDPASVEEAIFQLVALFQKLQRLPSGNVVGLVGELIFIAMSSSPKRALEAWHVDTTDRFDFSTGPLRVDCKATSLRSRVHEFSLEQTDPPPGARAFVMSVFVEPAGDGKSLSDLLSSIEGQVGDLPSVMRLRDLVAGSLGSTYLDHLNWKFDWELATASAGLYEVTEIPRIEEPLPPGVSRVRFFSDLSSVRRSSKASLASLPASALDVLPTAASVYS